MDWYLSKFDFKNGNIYEYSTDDYASLTKQMERIIYRIQNKYYKLKTYVTVFTFKFTL